MVEKIHCLRSSTRSSHTLCWCTHRGASRASFVKHEPYSLPLMLIGVLFLFHSNLLPIHYPSNYVILVFFLLFPSSCCLCVMSLVYTSRHLSSSIKCNLVRYLSNDVMSLIGGRVAWMMHAPGCICSV